MVFNTDFYRNRIHRKTGTLNQSLQQSEKTKKTFETNSKSNEGKNTYTGFISIELARASILTCCVRNSIEYSNMST